LVLLFGGYMVIHGTLGVGNILTFNLYLLMLQAPFMMLGMLIMMGQRAAASAERIYEILDEEPTVTDAPDAVDLVDCTGDVRFRHVDFAYNEDAEQLVLADFDLHVPPGQTVAIVGRTGAGKSTVARLLTRFYDVKHGSVELDGHDVRDLTLASLRANVGVVLDEPFLFSASVHDNIAYGKPSAGRDEVEAAAKASGAHEFISHLVDGYDTVVGERGYTLSGGQRQRIAIARTLLVNPPVLVLDDATSAIDVQVEQTIHAGLKVQMEGRTTLIIAHRLSTISLADRVVLLDQHKVVADGTHAELLATTPLYAEVLAQAAEFEAADEDEGQEHDDGRASGDTPLGAMLDAVRAGGRP
jgi:ATP-binding cassette subfamily B protein